MDSDKFKDFLGIALNGITKRRMRSWLTMVGIFIGIAAVIALIGLGQGLQRTVNAEFEKLGTDKVIISPAGSIFGAGGVDALTEHDIKLIKKIKGVDSVTGYLFSTAQVAWKDEQYWPIVMGISPEKDQLKLIEEMYPIEKGRWFGHGEKNKAVIGYDYAHSTAFKKPLEVGDKFTINGEDFDVVGMLEKVGNSQDDRTVIVPIDTARTLLGVPNRLDSIIVKVKADTTPEEVAATIEREMRKDRGQKPGEEDFNVQTFKDVIKSFLVILDIVTTVLAGIAGISLLIGAIGIMNTMYTSVLERTKEIGIMKAIGATNGDVLTLFLIESGLLGLAGGIIGILLGVGIASLTAYLAQTLGGFEYLKAHFSLLLIGGSLFFSFAIGVLSGVLPARKAARKNPVDSLRYE